MKRVHLLEALLLASAVVLSCSKENTDEGGSSAVQETFTDFSGTEVTTLDEVSPRVYCGWDMRWHQLTGNLDKWDYVRKNATGFYTNFIDMYYMVNENTKTAEQTLADLNKAFSSKYAFFEGSVETALNNSEATDRKTLELLTEAGFTVDYASVNYMTVAAKTSCQNRMNVLATYKGKRKVLYLCGPWCFNGNIKNDADAMEMSTWGDGTQTDGPLGYWYGDVGSMKQGSYSIVKRMNGLGKDTAIMLAPYAAGVAGYDASTDFLDVSKDCVFGHEDNNAAPPIWALWMYIGDKLQMFPECEKNEAGEEYAPCTSTGVAWWLLKHLNELPTITVDDQSVSSKSIPVKAGEVTYVNLKFRNTSCPNVELTPVIRAVYNTSDSNWKVKFKRSSSKADLTKQIVYSGGLNCNKSCRISKESPLELTLCIMPEKGASSMTMDIQAMSHITNTACKKSLCKLTFKVN